MTDQVEDGIVGGDAADEEKLSLLDTLKLLGSASRGSWLINMVNFSDGVAYFGMLALMTLFMEVNVGFSTGMATVAVGVFSMGVTIFQALGGGTISDRIGVRRALGLSLLTILIGRILLTASPSTPFIAAIAWVAILVMAFGEGLIQPALYSGIKEYTDPRAETMGYAVLYSIMNLGIVAAELISPKVREVYARRVEGVEIEAHPAAGITGVFWFFTIFTAIVLLLHLTLFTRKVEERSRVVKSEPHRGQGTMMERFRALPIMDVRFLFFIFVLLPVRTLFAHQFLTMPHYVVRAFPGEVGARWEWLSGLNPLVIVIFVPLFAAMTRRQKVVDMMILGTLVSALSTFLLATEPRLDLLVSYMIIFALGEAVWSSRFLEYIADIAPAGRIGVYMGIATLPWFLAKMVTGVFAGAAISRFVPAEGPQDPGTMWMIYGFVALLSPVGLLLARKWLLEQESAVTS